MDSNDFRRHLDKIAEAVFWAIQHHSRLSESNAALHCNEQIIYSPLVVKLHAAEQSLKFLKAWADEE